MKTIAFFTLCLASIAGCHDGRTELNRENVTRSLNAYLAVRGELCLAKSAWPIDVSSEEARAGSRNAVQMPALEKLGLVAGGDATGVSIDSDGNKSAVPVRRYRLTAEGNKYYLARPPHKYRANSRYAAAAHDFCAARLKLDKVIGWEPAGQAGKEAIVTYTYTVVAAPWAGDAGVRAVFPMVDTVIRGATRLQLKQAIVLAADGWEAKDL